MSTSRGRPANSSALIPYSLPNAGASDYLRGVKARTRYLNGGFNFADLHLARSISAAEVRPTDIVAPVGVVNSAV